MKIRKAIRSDSRGIFDAHMKSINEVCSKDYTPAQIKAWGGREYDPFYWPKIMERSSVWVVAEGVSVFGFINLALPKQKDTAHIKAFYIAPEAVGKGFGKQLLATALHSAKAAGFPKVFVDSTTTARHFYLSQGFEQRSSQTFCTINGAAIEGYPMERLL